MDEVVKEEAKKNFHKGIKKMPLLAWFVIPFLLVACVLAYSIHFRVQAENTGSMLGTGMGLAAGRFTGSFEALTTGQFEAYQAGKQEGLSAKDISAEVATQFNQVEKLEVLVASGTYSDLLRAGDDVDYAVLLTFKYNAVFTVDLNTAEIESEGNELHITLDQPDVQFILASQPTKRAEYQRKSLLGEAGTTESGYDALNNSINNMPAEAEKKLRSDESLMNAARSAARTQITELVNAMSALNPKPKVNIDFREGEATDDGI